MSVVLCFLISSIRSSYALVHMAVLLAERKSGRGAIVLTSSLFRMPASMILHGLGFPLLPYPTRYLLISSRGFNVAEQPTLCSFPSTRSCSRSRLTARCTPRLLSQREWTSSTMTVRMVCSAGAIRLLPRSRYRDSGVVIRMCGGFRIIFCRSLWGVSPERTATRISGSSPSAILRI